MPSNNLRPFEPTHPGQLIKDELAARDYLTKWELASLLGVKTSFLNEIFKGKRPITADVAVLLEKAMGIPATYWMNFQAQFDIHTAELNENNLKKMNSLVFGVLLMHLFRLNISRRKAI